MTRQPKIERKIQYLPIVGEVKATNDAQGIIEGYLNYIGNIDYTEDRTMKGAFHATLKDSYARKSHQSLDFLWPYLWSHDYDILPPGGIFDAEETSKGLYIKTRLNMETQSGRDLYSSFKMGTLRKQSMGYKCHKWEYVKEGGRNIRNLLEVEVVEGSAVIFPANDLSAVNVVKSTGKRSYFIMPPKSAIKDFNAGLQERMQDDWQEDLWMLLYALKSEIISAFQIGDQPVEDTRSALEQFSVAMLAYVQQGVDLGMVEALQPDDDGMDCGYMSSAQSQENKEGRTISSANHAMMTKAVSGIMGHCGDMNKMLQAAKPKSAGADSLPLDAQASEIDAVSTQFDELLQSLSMSNLMRGIKK